MCSKSERKITFAQFQKALELVAQKKYPGDGNGYKKLVDKVVSGKGPVAAGTTVSMEDGRASLDEFTVRLRDCAIGKKGEGLHK